MRIKSVYYFNEVGERGYMGTVDDTFGGRHTSSKLAYSLFNRNNGIGWECQHSDGVKRDVVLNFDVRCRAAFDVKNDLIVTLGQRAPELVAPKNAGVFNPDGSLNHVVELPNCVEHAFNDGVEKFDVDGFSHLENRNGEIVFFIRFAYDWFQAGVYDTVARRWGQILGTGRV